MIQREHDFRVSDRILFDEVSCPGLFSIVSKQVFPFVSFRVPMVDRAAPWRTLLLCVGPASILHLPQREGANFDVRNRCTVSQLSWRQYYCIT